MSAATRTPRTGRPPSTAPVPPCGRCGTPEGPRDPRARGHRPIRRRADRIGFPGLVCQKCFWQLDSAHRTATRPRYDDLPRFQDAADRPIDPEPGDEALLDALLAAHPWGLPVTADEAGRTWEMTPVEAMEVVGRLLVREPGACCPARRVVPAGEERDPGRDGPWREVRVYRCRMG